MIDIEKCTGCKSCELACSFYHEKEFNLTKSRIYVFKLEKEGVDAPLVCQHCDTPICEVVCPMKAIYRHPKTGAVLIDPNTCIGCRMCAISCPLGGISFDADKRRMIKCDLCDGDPKCVKICPTGAIYYVEATKASILKRRSSAEKLGELLRKLTITPTLA